MGSLLNKRMKARKINLVLVGNNALIPLKQFYKSSMNEKTGMNVISA